MNESLIKSHPGNYSRGVREQWGLAAPVARLEVGHFLEIQLGDSELVVEDFLQRALLSIGNVEPNIEPARGERDYDADPLCSGNQAFKCGFWRRRRWGNYLR